MNKAVSMVNTVTAANVIETGKGWVARSIKNCMVKLFPERKETRRIPVYELSSWGATMEACLSLPKDTREAVKGVFYTFDEETQRALTFSPKGQGEWIKRARFWQYTLKPSLSEKHYYAAMSAILKWYIHCVRNLRPQNKEV